MTSNDKKEYVKKFNAKHYMLNTGAELKYFEDTDEIWQTGFLTIASSPYTTVCIDKYTERAFIRNSNIHSNVLIKYDGDVLKELFVTGTSANSIKVVADNNRVLRGLCFKRNSKTTIIDLDDVDTSKISLISELFKGCSELRTINFGNMDTSRVEHMDEVFAFCSSLTALDLSKFNTKKVTHMDQMFKHCIQLKELNISSFNTERVVSMYSMFMQCKSLSTLDIRSFDMKNIYDMDYMFAQCENLANLRVSLSTAQYFKRNNTNNSVFKDCDKLNLFSLGEEY